MKPTILTALIARRQPPPPALRPDRRPPCRGRRLLRSGRHRRRVPTSWTARCRKANRRSASRSLWPPIRRPTRPARGARPHIDDGPEAGGIWFLDGETVDVDGDFITQLAEIYGDTNWQLYDPETGDVRYTGTLEECEAAARPDVDPAYQNYCVQCLPETLPEDGDRHLRDPLRAGRGDGCGAHGRKRLGRGL